MYAWSSRASGQRKRPTTKARITAGRSISRVWSVWWQGYNENGNGIALSSAAGDAALAACRPDRCHVVRWFSLGCVDAEHRSAEDRRSVAAYGRRHAGPCADGRPLHRPDADIAPGERDDRLSAPRSAGADHALRLLRAGSLGGCP